jgi:enoyl-CoA hydratase/2-(1,2-epoxy-1,2-dihydrophenyl)acetyl-CoA isomerase
MTSSLVAFDRLELADLSIERRGGIGIVRFDRPDRLNAFRSVTFDMFHRALAVAAVDPAVEALVLTGNGRGFCAGEDLDEMGDAAASGFSLRAARRELVRLQDLTRRLVAFPKGIVAAVNGPAVGLGAEMVLACPIRIAASSAYFLYPEARRAFVQTNGTFNLLPRVVGAGRAAEWLFTGRRIPAVEALRAGLISAMATESDLLELAVELASRRNPANG